MAGPLVRMGITSVMLIGTLVACTSTARISDVYTALDSNGDRKRSVFTTDSKEIHCVVEMGIGRTGATVNAFIRQLQAYDFETDKFIEVDRGQAEAENSPSPQDGIQKLDVSLKPSAPDGSDGSGLPFPPGRFSCEASLDGELEKSAIFNIDFPPCPDTLIIPATICFGFYKAKQQCPRYGNTSMESASCTCDALAGWVCTDQ
jgi:hypothetical protein